MHNQIGTITQCNQKRHKFMHKLFNERNIYQWQEQPYSFFVENARSNLIHVFLLSTYHSVTSLSLASSVHYTWHRDWHPDGKAAIRKLRHHDMNFLATKCPFIEIKDGKRQTECPQIMQQTTPLILLYKLLLSQEQYVSKISSSLGGKKLYDNSMFLTTSLALTESEKH